VKLGQEAKVFIDAYPDKPFTGKIIYISDKAEFTPKNVQTKDDRTKLVFGVKIEVPNADQMLKPGMPADARLVISQ
jgi:HlyD family secretion protein